jgi:hypothetical protein
MAIPKISKVKRILGIRPGNALRLAEMDVIAIIERQKIKPTLEELTPKSFCPNPTSCKLIVAMRMIDEIIAHLGREKPRLTPLNCTPSKMHVVVSNFGKLKGSWNEVQ